MSLPMKGDDVDIEPVKEIVDTFMQKGFTYFDMSPVYIMGKSESTTREAIVKRFPRDSFALATKMPMWLVQKERSRTWQKLSCAAFIMPLRHYNQ
jgi:uncharacterized protein